MRLERGSRAWRLWAAATLALAVVTTALCAAYLALSFQREALPLLQRNRLRAFEGAYAVYSGRVGLLLFTSEVSLTIRVLEHNSTHARVSIRMTAFGSERSDAVSVPLDNPWGPLGALLHHTETEYVEGLGVRECYVFDYGGGRLVYVDAETLWPVKFELDAKELGLELVLRLRESNVFRPK